MSNIFKSEAHPDIPYVLFGCKCSLCQRFGGPDNQVQTRDAERDKADVALATAILKPSA